MNAPEPGAVVCREVWVVDEKNYDTLVVVVCRSCTIFSRTKLADMAHCCNCCRNIHGSAGSLMGVVSNFQSFVSNVTS
jgi:hypothetical protein